MSDATLYHAATPAPIAIADIEVVPRYELSRSMLGAIHEPPNSANQNVHRSALPFGSRQGELQLVLHGLGAPDRANAIDTALKVNGLYYLDCPHFPQLHQMHFAVAGPYSVLYEPIRGRHTWIVTIPIKEVLG